MNVMRNRLVNHGFTIVELLIVVVVIGILASITIVAFNGIQTRAENTKTTSGIDQLAKAIQVYKVDTGTYPFEGNGQPLTIACIAELDQLCGYAGGTVAQGHSDCANVGYAASSAALDATIRSVINQMPHVSNQVIQCQNKLVKGAMYYYYNGEAYILYYLKGDAPCTTPGGTTIENRTHFTSGATRCNIRFPA